MDERAAAEIEDLRRLLEHPGWVVFSRDASEQLERLEKGALDEVKTIEDLAYRKGVRDTLRIIVNYENLLDASDSV